MLLGILILTSLMIAIALALETVGIWGRHWGAVINKPSTGYSLHVRTATFGRFLTFAAAPTLGLAVDQTGNSGIIILQGLIINTCLILLIICVSLLGLNRVLTFYSNITKSSAPVDLPNDNQLNFKILLVSSCAFLFTANGLVIANALGAGFPEYRASFVQLTSLITASGTLLHVFVADPLISKLIDTDTTSSQIACSSYLWGRVLGAFVSVLIFAVFLLVTTWFF